MAIALRAIRQLKGIRNDELMGAISQPFLSQLEQAKSLPSLPVLVKIADALGIHPLALIALVLGVRDQEAPEHELQRALEDLRSFQEAGGFKLMNEQQNDGTVKRRARGTKANAENVQAVLKLKKLGKNQLEVAQALGLPRTTVHRYWSKE
ncbi:helix-turn-helix transcriptional regulator [Pseudomonas sp. BIGb0427]|uniref:helix-turn-helix domain-containing protein n=1 Tax=Pseudomonas sp. BIGb0427 TaxID=2724470 RepID=UPI0016B2EDE8|nr:helix-turn-helix transcriptional regulator [Pseudomonas sp. BIGb0427]NLU58560.1 helix-turn-helix transcriptional regulator [Pseudomonas sp. BIGb0427]QPG63837.1 helix-turn-helix transcriptional regulator [Pseudomonas sp. BIGb0427]